MLTVKIFKCNRFQENTFLLYDEYGVCLIVDPGMETAEERDDLVRFIERYALKPVRLINTHCHVDHVMGNRFIFNRYGLLPEIHLDELPMLDSVVDYAPTMGFDYDSSPVPQVFLEDGDEIVVGKYVLKIMLTPGHSPGHVCLYQPEQNFLIGGDVLFRGGIGRTDLPQGNYKDLLYSIETKLLGLPDDCVVYPGHGEDTTIGFERAHNPFLK